MGLVTHGRCTPGKKNVTLFPERVCRGLYETREEETVQLGGDNTTEQWVQEGTGPGGLNLSLLAAAAHGTEEKSRGPPRWTNTESGGAGGWAACFSAAVLGATAFLTGPAARRAHAVPARVRPMYELLAQRAAEESWPLLLRHGVPVDWEVIEACTHSGSAAAGRVSAGACSLLACAAHRCLTLLRHLFLILHRNAALLLDSAPAEIRARPAAREALRATHELCQRLTRLDVLALLKNDDSSGGGAAATELALLVLEVRAVFVLTRVHLHAYRPSWPTEKERDDADRSAAGALDRVRSLRTHPPPTQ